jgi:hypothetical protein
MDGLYHTVTLGCKRRDTRVRGRTDRESAEAVLFQFSDDSISIISEPAELGGFLVQIHIKVLFDKTCNANQPFVFWEMGIVRRQRARQELGRDRYMLSTVVFCEPGNCRANGLQE